MIILSKITITLAMTLVALIHIYWLLGGLWPGKDLIDFTNKVLGRGSVAPGTKATAFVTLVFLFMAAVPWIQGLLPFEIYYYGVMALCGIFFARATFLLLPFIAKGFHEDFNRLNRRIYSPLCFILFLSYLRIFLELG